MRKGLFAAALLALAPRPIAALDDPLADVRPVIQHALTSDIVPSVAVAVARGGQIVAEEGFGWADRERRTPATPHTMYSLASISKPITATGLMLLVERGKIDLDKPINDYLGEAKLVARVGDAAQATVRRVANHSSGLPLHYQFFYADEPYRRPPMDETIRRYGNLVTAPGERYQYSNLGFGVIDHVLSRVSGRSFPEFMRQDVFLPLGMTHTSVDIGPGLESFAATRYGPDGTVYPFYDFDHPGGSAIFSSAHDLVRFGMFHLKDHLADQKAILTDPSIDAMHEPTSDKDAKGGGYGVGWSIAVNSRGLRTLSHSGGMGGAATCLLLVPEHDIAVAALCNTSNELPFSVAWRIVATLLPDKVDPADRPKPDAAEKPAAFKPEAPLVGTWSGTVHTYKADLPLTLEVRESGDVHVKLGDQLWTLLNEPSFKDGFLRGRFAGDVGTEDANRRPYLLSLEVKLRDAVLNGSLIALSQPGKYVGNALTHWVALERQKAGPSGE